MASDVKWIKLKVGMFDGRSFKKIKRAKIGGESYRDKLTAVWFELMDFAGKCNRSGAFIDSHEIPFSSFDDIAVMIDREPDELELCMRFFINEGMVAVVDDIYMLANWAEHQNEDGLATIREKNRERQARFREKKRLMLECTPSDGNDGGEKDNVTVTLCNALDKDTDLEGDKKKELYISVVSYLNEKLGTNYKHTTAKTQSAIRARLAEGFTVDDFKTVINKKCAEWIGTEYEKYLRPETLFGTKFEGYLNAKQTERKNGNGQVAGDSGGDRIGNYL